jgi:hypothetical protein
MRVKDALSHGFHVEAVLTGSSMNNGTPMSSASSIPNVGRQAAAIAEAMAVACVEPHDIGLVEAEGWAIYPWDTAEITALREVWNRDAQPIRRCFVGSVKSNIGHLDAAGGIVGLIKAILAIKQRLIPPVRNVSTPHPMLRAEDSPFSVPLKVCDWLVLPRRAIVNSFGLGGTNCHVIAEEYPLNKESSPHPGQSVVPWRSQAHVFVSYVKEDAALVSRLCGDLAAHGITTWRDREALKPGQRWKREIAEAIRSGGFFLACFSDNYYQRDSTYMNEELIIAIEELRRRPADRMWFLPVLLSRCDIPSRSVGAGETLQDLHAVSLVEDWERGILQLVSVMKQ